MSADNIEKIQRRKLDLRHDDKGDEDGHPHRPEIRLWAEQDIQDGDDDADPFVSVCIDSLWGQQSRYLEMSPDEARTLAVLLKQVADDIDSVRGNT